MTSREPVAERAARLRREFDARFASPPVEAIVTVDFLLVRIGGRPYALRLAQLGGVAKSRIVARAPTRRPEFLGLAGIRGRVVGIYGMATLLGGSEAPSSTSWLALSGEGDPVALAFEQLDAFVRIDRSSVHDEGRSEGAGRFVHGMIETEPVARPIVDLARIFAAVRRSTEATGSPRRDP